MAYKKSRKMQRTSKIEPSVMTLTLSTPDTVGGRYYVDLSQCASLVNRRFYRQGINWAVAGIKVSSSKAGTLLMGKLPNTWVMSNAWEKAMRAWSKMNNEALAEAESVRPRFLDFKIYADQQHHAQGYGGNLLPRSFTGALATAGEWEPSKVVVPETSTALGAVTEYELVAVGASNPGPGASGLNAKSLIQGYAAGRGLPNVLDPNTPDDAANYGENWMMAMFNEGTLQDATVLGELIEENNIAPYPFENDGTATDTMYPGGENQLAGLQWHDIVTLYESNATNGVGTQRVKGGNFPCGLIAFDWTPDSAANVVLQIDLIPGSHRGYLCEAMTEM